MTFHHEEKSTAPDRGQERSPPIFCTTIDHQDYRIIVMNYRSCPDDDDHGDVDIDDCPSDVSMYSDLSHHLSSSRDDVRKMAVSGILVALSSTSTSSSSSCVGNDAASKLMRASSHHRDGQSLVTRLCRVASMSDQERYGSNDALRSLLILCSDDIVGDQCVLDFVGGGIVDGIDGRDVEDRDDDDVEDKSGDYGNGGEGGGEKGGRGIARMLEITLSNPPPFPYRSYSSSSHPSPHTEEMDQRRRRRKDHDEWSERVDLACSLLANATRTERGAAEFVGLSFPDEAIPTSSSTSTSSSSSSSSMTPKETKPTATLLLSRFMNVSYVNVESRGYAMAYRAWTRTPSSTSGARNDGDSDVDYSDDDDEEGDDDGIDGAATSAGISNTSGAVEEGGCYDPYQHVAAVLMNVTQLERGRDFLMRLIHNRVGSGSGSGSVMTNGGTGTSAASTITTTTTTSHLQSLLHVLSTSPNPIRRRGVAGAIKNCCFSQDSIWWLLNVVRIDKSLLLPLCGPEELSIDEKVGLDPDYWLMGPNKFREPDAHVRLYVVEALLLLLASGRRARDTLRERRAYVIVKLADMVEVDENVTERLLECVQYLRRDEDGTEEGSSDRRAYESYARGMMDANNAKNHRADATNNIDDIEDDGPTSSAIAGLASDGRDGDKEDADYDNVD